MRKNNISNFNTVIVCAGTIGRISKFENLIVKDYNKTFQINLFGQIELSKFLIKKTT